VEDSQHVRYEEDQQYGAQPDARTSTNDPSGYGRSTLHRLRSARSSTLKKHLTPPTLSDGAWLHQPSINTKGRERNFPNYCSFAYSVLASFRMGISGSASFQSFRKSS
jgi:hypothetical protein